MSEESFDIYETYNSEQPEGEEEKEQEAFEEANERNEYYESLFKESDIPGAGSGTEVLKRHFQMDLEKQHHKSIMPPKK